MDLSTHSEAKLYPHERILAREPNVKLCHGHQRTSNHKHDVILTTHRLLWALHGDLSSGGTARKLELKHVASMEDVTTSFFLRPGRRKKGIILHLQSDTDLRRPQLKMSSKNGISLNFRLNLDDAWRERLWENLNESSDTFMESEKDIKKTLAVDVDYCKALIVKMLKKDVRAVEEKMHETLYEVEELDDVGAESEHSKSLNVSNDILPSKDSAENLAAENGCSKTILHKKKNIMPKCNQILDELRDLGHDIKCGTSLTLSKDMPAETVSQVVENPYTDIKFCIAIIDEVLEYILGKENQKVIEPSNWTAIEKSTGKNVPKSVSVEDFHHQLYGTLREKGLSSKQI